MKLFQERFFGKTIFFVLYARKNQLQEHPVAYFPVNYCCYCYYSCGFSLVIFSNYTHSFIISSLKNVGNNASLSKFLRSQKDHLKRPEIINYTTFLLKASILDQSAVRCSKCFGVYSRKFFYRHRNRCGDSGVCPVPTNLQMATANVDLSDMFRRNILGTLRHGQIGKVVRCDEAILTIGAFFYEKLKRKIDKAMEVYFKILYF